MYDSEINVRIESFWDAEWRVAIMVHNKWVYATNYDIVDFDEIISGLQDLIKEHLPDSAYAKTLLAIDKIL